MSNQPTRTFEVTIGIMGEYTEEVISDGEKAAYDQACRNLERDYDLPDGLSVEIRDIEAVDDD